MPGDEQTRELERRVSATIFHDDAGGHVERAGLALERAHAFAEHAEVCAAGLGPAAPADEDDAGLAFAGLGRARSRRARARQRSKPT